ncbi:MAG: AmmeMemoRadiSam system protein B [Proteobacteria bacterium]|nr:AmmeMemoRadiSam system protein B [Pseudomonadota bacterium]
MAFVRPPAVAGTFYAAGSQELAKAVCGYLAQAGQPRTASAAPKAIIAPHAGYVYSGQVAARAYARLAPLRKTITRVVILGPAHYVPLRGLAVSNAEAFATPLGIVPVDREAVAGILAFDQVRRLEAAHEREHSIEVHLPFLQWVLEAFHIVPLLVGEAREDDVAEVLEALWGGQETLIVVSSDLSHYHDSATARRLDAATSAAIEAGRGDAIGLDQACGAVPIRSLIKLAKRHRLRARTIDFRNSGDTAGPRDRVVGYGAYVLA